MTLTSGGSRAASPRTAGRFVGIAASYCFLALGLAGAVGCSYFRPRGSDIAAPAPGGAWTNSLSMPFVAVAGTRVLFSALETRVSDFEAFVRATGYDAGNTMFIAESNQWMQRPHFNWCNPGFAQEATHPVVGVNWHDAQAFCQWLTERERAAGALTPDQRYRLPTDFEWSRAVDLTNEPGRTPQDRFVQIRDIYPWGTNAVPPPNVGNLSPSFGVDAFARTAPVASFPPNAHGLYDLVGNVIEWCEDWWNDDARYRVLRGSGWHTECASCLMSSYRYPNYPELRIDYYGFRVVLEVGKVRQTGGQTSNLPVPPRRRIESALNARGVLDYASPLALSQPQPSFFVAAKQSTTVARASQPWAE